MGEALLSPRDHILGGRELTGMLLTGRRTWEPRCQTLEPASDLSLSGRVISARLRLLKTRNPAWISLLRQAAATARTQRPSSCLSGGARSQETARGPSNDKLETTRDPLGQVPLVWAIF